MTPRQPINRAAAYVECHECAATTSPVFAYEKVTGYVKTRHGQKGGINQLAMRESTGEYLCESCMTLLKSGLLPGQQALEIDA